MQKATHTWIRRTPKVSGEIMGTSADEAKPGQRVVLGVINTYDFIHNILRGTGILMLLQHIVNCDKMRGTVNARGEYLASAQ